MILSLSTTVAIPALAGQPRHVHHAGAWFADPTGVATHCMSFALWALLGRPEEIEVDFGVTDEQVAAATLDSAPLDGDPLDDERETLEKHRAAIAADGLGAAKVYREKLAAARAMPVGRVRLP